MWDIWKTDISNIFGSIGRSRKCDEECVWESICIFYFYLFMRKSDLCVLYIKYVEEMLNFFSEQLPSRTQNLLSRTQQSGNIFKVWILKTFHFQQVICWFSGNSMVFTTQKTTHIEVTYNFITRLLSKERRNTVVCCVSLYDREKDELRVVKQNHVE